MDAMGGDFAPKNNVEGAVLALKEYPELEKLFLVGDAVAIGNVPSYVMQSPISAFWKWFPLIVPGVVFAYWLASRARFMQGLSQAPKEVVC